MSLYDRVPSSERALVQLCYKLSDMMKRLARYKNHLTFLIRCREDGIIPKGLRITLPVRSPNKWRLALIARETSQALLHLLIQDNRTMKVKLEKEINTYSESLTPR